MHTFTENQQANHTSMKRLQSQLATLCLPSPPTSKQLMELICHKRELQTDGRDRMAPADTHGHELSTKSNLYQIAH